MEALSKEGDIVPALRAQLELFSVTHNRPALKAALRDAIQHLDAADGPAEQYVDVDRIVGRVRAMFLDLVRSTLWQVLLMLSITGAVVVSMLLVPNPQGGASDSQKVLA